jgi:N-methylhydantoinase A
MSKVRVAVDIGGTFTDICILDEKTNHISIAKVPSSNDPIEAALEGISKANIDLRDVSLFSHGTTVATNALNQRNFPHSAMIVTDGFRDVIEIGNSAKEDLWDAYKDCPPDYIRRRDRLPIGEKTTSVGIVEQEVNEAEAKLLAEKLRKLRYQAIAICFMNSFANNANELALKKILERELPGIAISTSAEVLPEMFEHDRFSTAVVNAVLQPVVGEYALRLQDRLKQGCYKSDVLLLHGGGGVMTPKTVDAELAEYEVDSAATESARSKIAAQRVAWLREDPSEIAKRFRAGELDEFDVIRKHGVICDWGTGELLENSTEDFRGMMIKRSVDYWDA